MIKSNLDLVRALHTDEPLEGKGKILGTQIERVGVSLGALILKLLPEGENKELAKQRLVECIFYCKQSLKLKK